MAGRFGGLEEGRYKGVILRHTFGASAQKGTPELAFICRIDFQLVPDEDGTEHERETDAVERTVRRYISDGTIDFVVPLLQSLGYDRDTFDDLDPKSENPFDFYGKQVELEMRFEEYKGKSVERWEFARDKKPHKPLERSAVAKLNAAYGGKLKVLRRDPNAPAPTPALRTPALRTPALRTPATAAAAANNGPASQNDDEQIPF